MCLAHARMAQGVAHAKTVATNSSMQSSLWFPPTMSSTSFTFTPLHFYCPSTPAPSRSSCITLCGTVPREDEHGPMAADAPLTGYEPNQLEILEDDDDANQIFTDRYFTQFLNDSDTEQRDPVEIDDEHRRSEFTPSLQVQERRVNIDLSQTHHSHGESLLRSAPLISHTEKPGSVSNERELSQGLEDEGLMSAHLVQREHILAEAKSEIQKYEGRASFDEKNTCAIWNVRLRLATGIPDVILKGFWKPVKLKIDFNKKWLTENNQPQAIWNILESTSKQPNCSLYQIQPEQPKRQWKLEQTEKTKTNFKFTKNNFLTLNILENPRTPRNKLNNLLQPPTQSNLDSCGQSWNNNLAHPETFRKNSWEATYRTIQTP